LALGFGCPLALRAEFVMEVLIFRKGGREAPSEVSNVTSQITPSQPHHSHPNPHNITQHHATDAANHGWCEVLAKGILVAGYQ